MSDEFLFLELLECDYEESDSQRKNNLHKRRRIREQLNPFDHFDDKEFIKKYGLSKELVKNLCCELKPKFRIPRKCTDLSIEAKVLTALSFYATGSYQRPIGDIGTHTMAQQTVSSVIAEVTACIDSPEMRRKYICFPKTLADRNKIRAKFYENFKFPGVLGCISCTHIAIVRPAKHEERFFNRKHYHSLNVQLICDADMQIISVDASYGGATHNSFIWNENPIKSHLENLNESTWLLGDSGYALRKNMMTPFINAIPGTQESHYMDMHLRTRNLIERTIRLLKARFRCLLVHRGLHYKPMVAASITNACVILHNICNKANIPVLDFDEQDVLQEFQLQAPILDANFVSASSCAEDLWQGVNIRNSLMCRLWDERLI